MDSSDVINASISDDNYESYDEENEDRDVTSDIELSDEGTFKQSDTIESLKLEDSVVQSPPVQINDRIKLIKQRYTRRISLFEITGILCESFNLLQRGRIPLLNNLSKDTFSENSLIQAMFEEIEQGNCPIIVQKNGELLSLNDFDEEGVKYHLNYIKTIWKKQRKL